MAKDGSATRNKLLEAALKLIRTKGYAATTVDDLCAEADVTKGGFFHHFASKEILAVEAAKHFSSTAEALFQAAPYRKNADPLDRLLGYVDFRIHILDRPVSDFTCLLGTMIQEVYASHPAIRDACCEFMSVHIDVLVADIDEARVRYGIEADWTSESLGYYIQSVLQGAFIFAKAKGDNRLTVESLKHLRRYLESTFTNKATENSGEKILR